MYQYVVQFRQVRVATTQINSAIKHICFYYVSYQAHLKIYHQHKLTTLFITLLTHLFSHFLGEAIYYLFSPQ